MAHRGHAGWSGVILVEMGYVTLTSGVYAALQQRAIRIRSRVLGSLTVALGVPGLAQLLDWTAHRITSTAVAGRVTFSVCLFALISAVFHLHLMRKGMLLAGSGRSLVDDLHGIAKLILRAFLRPFAFAGAIPSPAEGLESDAAL
jgi:hypothetical protein